MKQTYFALIVLAAGYLPATAQPTAYTPSSAHCISVSAGGGVAVLFSDFKTRFYKPVARLNLDCKLNPYLSVGIEGQAGRLSASKIDIPAVAGMHVDNTFEAGNINLRVVWGTFFKAGPRSVVNGLYAGAGAGIMHNHIDANRNEILIDNQSSLAAGKRYSGTVFVAPFNIGWDIDLHSFSNIKNIGINLNYQHNLSTDDHLDGFRVLTNANNYPDSYGYLSIAIKYYFGKVERTDLRTERKIEKRGF